MKHIIIGTAGHVDHGKTLLIKALTGIDTDRLQEEKKRGITIELGFAHLDFADGISAGIVDVPGHERFIRNMLAGAGGIDVAMLVVAADEGFMPQTVEHLGILTLLGIDDGIVVITKKDMVDAEWLEMVTEDIKTRIEGTFLEGKPIVPVSAYTGEGIDLLKDILHDAVIQAREKDLRPPFRLPVDRAFTVEGFGTVVTGTLVEGYMRVGDAGELVPSGGSVKIRNLQVHGQNVETAYAGQRVAVNIAGIKKEDVARGDAVVKPGSVRTSDILDVRLENLKNSGRIIRTGSKVHFYHGSGNTLAKVVILNRERIEPGESSYAQLRLESMVGAKMGDRFVVRFFSPLETIGGGQVIDPSPCRHKRYDPEVIEALTVREGSSVGNMLVQMVSEWRCIPNGADALAVSSGISVEQVEQELKELVNLGKIIEPVSGRYVAASALEELGDNCEEVLARYHRDNPLHAGMRAAELRQKVLTKTDGASADALLSEIALMGRIKLTAQGCYALSDFEVVLTKRQSAVRRKILELYEKSGIESPAPKAVEETLEPKERADFRQVMESLVSSGELVMLTPQVVISVKSYEEALAVAAGHFAKNETLTLAEYRDILGTSRKYALALLEYFDKNHITRKDGSARRANVLTK